MAEQQEPGSGDRVPGRHLDSAAGDFPVRDPASTNHLPRLVGFAATIACGVYFVVVAARHASDFPALRLDAASVAGLGVATLVFLVTMLLGGVTWHIALRAAGEPPNVRPAIAAVMMSQIAKYVPGNFAHVVGRLAIGHRHGFAMPRMIFAMAFETGWTIVAAVAVAAVALAAAGPAAFAALPALSPAGIGAVLAVALVAPVAGALVLGRWRPRPLSRWVGDTDVRLPGIGPTVACFGLYVAAFALAGLALDLLARGPLGAAESRFVLLTGVFAVAWVAGYVTPGAPGGLGVREAILVAALGPVYDPGTAVALALVLRACTMAADGLGFLVGFAIRRG